MSKLGKSSGFRRLFRRAPSQDIEKVISPGIAPSQSLEEIHALAQSYTGGPGSRSSHKSRLVSLQLDPTLCLTLESGVTSMQGERKYMEDRHVVFDDLREELPDAHYQEGIPYSYWAVYDGHAGFKAAEICKDCLHKEIMQSEHFKSGDIFAAIQDGLEKVDLIIIEKGTEEGWTEGCCVSLVIIVDNILYTANLGDSHMAVSRNINRIEAIQLTEAHKASEKKEKERITKAGGMVMRNRLFGDLSISRALGDLNYKKPKQEENYVSNEAFMRRIPLTQNNDFIIIASDGLWDTMSFKEAMHILYHNKEKSAEELSKILADETHQRGSQDNITVIVVILVWLSKDDVRSDPL